MLGILGAGNTKHPFVTINWCPDRHLLALFTIQTPSLKTRLPLCSAGYVAYFIAACVLDFQRAIALVVLTSLAVGAVSYEVASAHLGERVSKAFRPVVRVFKRHYKWIKW